MINGWIKPEEYSYTIHGEVLCEMKSNGNIVSGYIGKSGDKFVIKTNPDFKFDDWGDYEVSSWHPIPKTPIKNPWKSGIPDTNKFLVFWEDQVWIGMINTNMEPCRLDGFSWIPLKPGTYKWIDIPELMNTEYD